MLVVTVILDVEWPPLCIQAKSATFQYGRGEVGGAYRSQGRVECLAIFSGTRNERGREDKKRMTFSFTVNQTFSHVGQLLQ